MGAWLGLNNVTRDTDQGVQWLAVADNIDITDRGRMVKRAGYALAKSGAFKSAFSTSNERRMYLATASAIVNFAGVTLAALTSTLPVSWCEVNDMVLFDNGTDSGMILPDDTVLPWRGTTLADLPVLAPDGAKIEDLAQPLPLGTHIVQHWRGRIYAAQYMPSENQTVVWYSNPLGFHRFDVDTDFFMVPGNVTMLAPHAEALVVGTNQEIYSYTGESLAVLADYGVVPGQHWDNDGSRILFWSKRGLCAAMPLVLLTENQISVAPGSSAGGCLVQAGGQKRFLAVLEKGGMPYNPYGENP